MPQSDFFAALGQIAISVQAAPSGVPGRIWDELRPWLARLAMHAAPKWLPRLSFGFPCQVPVFRGGQPIGACPRSAIAACDVCGQPCCLDHSRIDQFGDAICFPCVAEAIRIKRGGPPPPTAADHAKELAWARKILGVKKNATFEEMKTAHRKQSARWHPDRHPHDQAGAEAKFKDVQRAFELLRKAHEEAA